MRLMKIEYPKVIASNKDSRVPWKMENLFLEPTRDIEYVMWWVRRLMDQDKEFVAVEGDFTMSEPSRYVAGIAIYTPVGEVETNQRFVGRSSPKAGRKPKSSK